MCVSRGSAGGAGPLLDGDHHQQRHSPVGYRERHHHRTGNLGRREFGVGKYDEYVMETITSSATLLWAIVNDVIIVQVTWVEGNLKRVNMCLHGKI